MEYPVSEGIHRDHDVQLPALYGTILKCHLCQGTFLGQALLYKTLSSEPHPPRAVTAALGGAEHPDPPGKVIPKLLLGLSPQDHTQALR